MATATTTIVLRTHIASGASANLAETTKARPAVAAIEPQGLAQQTPFPRNYAEAWTSACAFTAATLIYIALAMTANRVMAVIERRTSVPGYLAGAK